MKIALLLLAPIVAQADDLLWVERDDDIVKKVSEPVLLHAIENTDCTIELFRPSVMKSPGLDYTISEVSVTSDCVVTISYRHNYHCEEVDSD